MMDIGSPFGIAINPPLNVSTMGSGLEINQFNGVVLGDLTGYPFSSFSLIGCTCVCEREE